MNRQQGLVLGGIGLLGLLGFGLHRVARASGSLRSSRAQHPDGILDLSSLDARQRAVHEAAAAALAAARAAKYEAAIEAAREAIAKDDAARASSDPALATSSQAALLEAHGALLAAVSLVGEDARLSDMIAEMSRRWTEASRQSLSHVATARRIHEHAEAAQRLIQAGRDLARVEAEVELSRQRLDLARALHRAVRSRVYEVQARGAAEGLRRDEARLQETLEHLARMRINFVRDSEDLARSRAGAPATSTALVGHQRGQYQRGQW